MEQVDKGFDDGDLSTGDDDDDDDDEDDDNDDKLQCTSYIQQTTLDRQRTRNDTDEHEQRLCHRQTTCTQDHDEDIDASITVTSLHPEFLLNNLTT